MANKVNKITAAMKRAAGVLRTNGYGDEASDLLQYAALVDDLTVYAELWSRSKSRGAEGYAAMRVSQAYETDEELRLDEAIREAVRELYADVIHRYGMRSAFESLDADVRDGIRASWRKIIERAVRAASGDTHNG